MSADDSLPHGARRSSAAPIAAGGQSNTLEPAGDYLRASGLWGTWARVGIAASGSAVAWIFMRDVTPLHVALLFYLAMALVSVEMLRRGVNNRLRMAAFLAIDACAAALAVWSIGSTISVMPVMYLLLVTGYSVRGGRRFGTAAYWVALTNYTAIVVFEATGVLPRGPLAIAEAEAYANSLAWPAALALFGAALTATYLFLNHFISRIEWFTSVAQRLSTSARSATEHSATLQAKLDEAGRLESLGRLAGGVAHDFNNVLTSILVHGGILRDQMSPNDPRREDIGEVISAAERASHLTAAACRS